MLEERLARVSNNPPVPVPNVLEPQNPRRSTLSNGEIADSVRTAMEGLQPRATRVLVVGKGDPELLKAAGAYASPFPQGDDGAYAGYYPEDDTDALDHLRMLRARGADCLLFPQTAFWWLDHYRGFADHLDGNFLRVVADDASFVMYRLSEPRAAAAERQPFDHNEDLDLERRLQALCLAALAQDRELRLLFDSNFYLRAYPDVAATGVDPLFHYLVAGAMEYRDPNPLFDTNFYLTKNADVAHAHVNPLLHYLMNGADEGRDPNPRFDSWLYRRDHGTSLPEGTNPLADFLSTDAVSATTSKVLGQGSWNWTRLIKQLVQSMCPYTRCRVTASPPRAAVEGEEPPIRALKRDGEPVGGVLVVSHDAEFNGAQLIALSLVGQLARRHAAPVFVILKRGGPLLPDFEELAPTVVLDEVDLLGAGTCQFDSLIATFKALGVEAAICNTIVTGDVAERLKANDLAVVSAIHELPGAVMAYGTAELFRQSIRSSDHVVFPAQYVRDRLMDAFGERSPSEWVHPQGILRPNPFVDEREFAKLQISKQLNIPEGAVTVLGCGLASQRKGFDLFIVLARTVLSRQHALPVHFVWVGPTDDTFALWCLHDIEMAGLKAVVHVVGAQKHAGLFYAASDIFVLTSREDPFPTVCLEAMEAGVPVVAFEDAGGIGEMVGPSSGVLVPYLDIVAMADAVSGLVEDDRRRSALGTSGRARVSDLNVEKYAHFLLNLVARPDEHPRG